MCFLAEFVLARVTSLSGPGRGGGVPPSVGGGGVGCYIGMMGGVVS